MGLKLRRVARAGDALAGPPGRRTEGIQPPVEARQSPGVGLGPGARGRPDASQTLRNAIGTVPIALRTPLEPDWHCAIRFAEPDRKSVV